MQKTRFSGRLPFRKDTEAIGVHDIGYHFKLRLRTYGLHLLPQISRHRQNQSTILQNEPHQDTCHKVELSKPEWLKSGPMFTQYEWLAKEKLQVEGK